MTISLKKKGDDERPLATHDVLVAPKAPDAAAEPTRQLEPEDSPRVHNEPVHRAPSFSPPPGLVASSPDPDLAATGEMERIKQLRTTTRVEMNDDDVPRAIYKHAASTAGFRPGMVIDERYRLKESIGSGGMAQVWLAEHIAIEKLVAIKVLAPRGASADPHGELADRFLREAKATAAIKHTGVVDITDFGRIESGVPYFVMEHLDGETLHSVIRHDGPMHWLDARDTLTALAEALDAGHARGIVHCDLKPSNVFVVEQNGARAFKIIDFGIAKLTEFANRGKSITIEGTITGTPSYMSPEQTRGRELDARTDVYALACMAYFLLSGRPPFEAKDTGTLLKMQLYSPPPVLRDLDPEIPVALEAAIAKALEKDPDKRHQTMREFRHDLEAAGEDFAVQKAVDHVEHERDNAKTLIRYVERIEPGPSDADLSGSRSASGSGVMTAFSSSSNPVVSSTSTGPAEAAASRSEPVLRPPPQPKPSDLMRSPAPAPPRANHTLTIVFGVIALIATAVAVYALTK